jgi:hypothetical protein
VPGPTAFYAYEKETVMDRCWKHQRSPCAGVARPGLQYIEGIRRSKTAAWPGITRRSYPGLRQLIMAAGSIQDDRLVSARSDVATVIQEN